MLQANAKAGTFVEIKNSTIGAGSKVPHLSYIGDADIGRGLQHRRRLDHRQLRRPPASTGRRSATASRSASTPTFVAPVKIGDRAYTAAGSVITKDVPDGALGVARQRQTNIEGYAERKTPKERD